MVDQLDKLSPEKRSVILQAGIDEFSQRAFTDASTDSITLAAGISKGLLFHYFGSKKAFYLYCLDVSLQRLVANSPVSAGTDFFDILFQIMNEKIRLCRDFPKETLMVNLAARDASAAIHAEKLALFTRYSAETTKVSQQLLSRAIATLPLKQPNDPKLLDALMLYISAINQKYLLQYRETPQLFFDHSLEIQSEMRTYINFMLEGIIRQEAAQ